ncbi:FAD/NAD(P)-binding domain-containing protein [Hypoxylon fragiforme]|uniref:FAD/NAD(P)-binding domain-containing protein n=1 Tax=Hypoxylon fragiforme TaxID=63214 RepID=UPI0020C72E46|nr:FAD/NAD(P)-binding domain-containing protein [Hypoxylon fragiforme]KAI2608859.1 FAD/NAD(P)-binding domain-containing protein [Hypoxylon fragiforme]
MAENDKSLPVLIIGSGSSGLTLAHGLHLKGIPYKIFEKDASIAPRHGRDWGINGHWSMPMLAAQMGAEKYSRINSVLVDPYLPLKEVESGPILNGATGERIGEVVIPDMHRLLRSRLRALLVEGVLDVQFNKTLARVAYAEDGRSATAYFADGTQEMGRLIVGADGSHSTVRSLLVGEERTQLKRLPLVATFVTMSFPREEALRLRNSGHPIVNVILHPDDKAGLFAILDAKDKDAPERWQFMFYVSWPYSVEEQDKEAGMDIAGRIRQIKEKGAGFVDPLRSCLDALPDDHTAAYHVQNGNWDPSLPEHAWDNHGGLVTLIGDAAHPMTYHRGQGLNHAITDAFKITELLSSPEGRSQAELINEYESDMRVRGGEEVRLSEMNSLMLHDWVKVQESPLLKRGLKRV